MAQTNPDFVRLSDHMVNGCVVDMDTGWSLSGFDVQPFPENKDQIRFVRRKINAGVIEPASQAEYSEAHPDGEEDTDDDVAKLGDAIARGIRGGGSQQEHILRQREGARHGAIVKQRNIETLRSQGVDVDDDADDSELTYAAEAERLAQLEKEQEEAGLATDDADEQKERTATRAPAKKTAAKASGARKRS